MKITEIKKIDDKKYFRNTTAVYEGNQPELSLDIIERYRQKISFVGVKIWSVGSGLYLDDKKYYRNPTAVNEGVE